MFHLLVFMKPAGIKRYSDLKQHSLLHYQVYFPSKAIKSQIKKANLFQGGSGAGGWKWEASSAFIDLQITGFLQTYWDPIDLRSPSASNSNAYHSLKKRAVHSGRIWASFQSGVALWGRRQKKEGRVLKSKRIGHGAEVDLARWLRPCAAV